MEFTIRTRQTQELVDITQNVQELISDVDRGICHVFVKHATAAVVINENADPNICVDFLNALNKSFPDHAGYLHDRVDNNAGAHIKSALLGPSETMPIKDGRLDLGTWQSLMLVELDGPRERMVRVEVLGKA